MHATFIRSCLFLAGFLTLAACYSDRPVDEVATHFALHYQQEFMTDRADIGALAGLLSRLDSLSHYRDLLNSVDTHALSTDGRLRKQHLQTEIEGEWAYWQPYQTNPALYNLGGLLKQELVRTDRDLPGRLQQMAALMDQADTYYRQARMNLQVDDVSLYRLASQKQYLGLEFLQGELDDSLRVAALSPLERELFKQKIGHTTLALKDYLAFCESVYLNHRDSTHYALQKNELR